MGIHEKKRLALICVAGVVGCLALGSCGGGGSSSAPLPPAPAPVPAPPTIATQPPPFSAAAGSAASVSVVANNATTYQWQRSVDAGTTWADLALANSATLSLPITGLIDSGTQYRVVAANSVGSVTSAAAQLTVRPSLRLLAGAIGGAGYLDATGATARFDAPRGVAVDSSGNLFVADGSNHVIRRITPAGVVTTYAGTPNVSGRTDGPAATARFDTPRSIAVDAAGTLWVIDQGTCFLRRIAAGMVTSVASLNVGGCYLASTATFGAADPAEVAVGPSGDVFVSDRVRHVIRRIDGNGTVTLFAGGELVVGSSDGPRLGGATFKAPRGLTFDAAGNLYVADSGNFTVRRIATDGTVTTVAGTALQGGHVDAVGPAARFNGPRGLALAGAQRLIVSDVNDETIRQIDLPSQAVTTLAGSAGMIGSADGTGPAARFYAPFGLAADTAGTTYVADTNNHMVRRIDTAGVVSRVAGQPDQTGSADGAGSIARFAGSNPIVADAAGNLYMADGNNYLIRKISTAGAVSTLAGAAGVAGSSDGPGSTARFNYPTSVALDGASNVYVSDAFNHTIRRISSSGVVSTIAGATGVSGDVDGPAAVARFGNVTHIAADTAGNVVIAEQTICRIRRLSAAGVVSTLAGDGSTCSLVDGPPGIGGVGLVTAMLYETSGSVVFVDENVRVRRLKTDGSIETIAGSGEGNIDGPGATAAFQLITALAQDNAGRIYVADSGNHSIRLIKPDRTVSTLVPRAPRPNVVLGEPPALRYPTGIALLPGNAIAITSEGAVLVD